MKIYERLNIIRILLGTLLLIVFFSIIIIGASRVFTVNIFPLFPIVAGIALLTDASFFIRYKKQFCNEIIREKKRHETYLVLLYNFGIPLEVIIGTTIIIVNVVNIIREVE